MKRVLSVCLLGLIVLSVSPDCFAKDKKVKYGKTGQVVYVGEVEKKVPAGKGTLTVRSLDKNSADILAGLFNCPLSLDSGTVEGELLFSSNYSFKGTIEYVLNQAFADYALSKGSITTDGGLTFNLEEEEILHFRRIYGTGSFEIRLPDQENIMWMTPLLVDTELYREKDWNSLLALSSNSSRHLGQPGQYKVMYPYCFSFDHPDKWVLEKEKN